MHPGGGNASSPRGKSNELGAAPLATDGPTPLVDALVERALARTVRLCVPGHGGGQDSPPAMRRALRAASLWALDYTEVPGLDDLAWPHGPIHEAEILLAEAFEATGAAILVGGSTAGILASLLALCEAGRTVALGRTSHRSVYAALALGQLEPAFLTEGVDAATGYSLGLGCVALEEIVRLRPSVVVVSVESGLPRSRALPSRGRCSARSWRPSSSL